MRWVGFCWLLLSPIYSPTDQPYASLHMEKSYSCKSKLLFSHLFVDLPVGGKLAWLSISGKEDGNWGKKGSGNWGQSEKRRKRTAFVNKTFSWPTHWPATLSAQAQRTQGIDSITWIIAGCRVYGVRRNGFIVCSIYSIIVFI